MADYNSKYSGEQVEALLDQVASGNAGGGGGGITVETDPIFSGSPAADITEEKMAEWDNKYAKPSGGIPQSDLAEEVKGALRKAEQYTGTVTEIKVNGNNIGASGGVVDLGNLVAVDTVGDLKIIAIQGFINNNLYALPNAANGDEDDILLSRDTVKTINGESIVGSGDITITGGSGAVGPQGPQGDKGDKGDTGPQGEDGVGIASVKQTTTSTADGGTNVVTVTLSNGTTSTFNVKNGSKGSSGTNGTNGTNGKDGADGEDGVTFTPSVDSAGNLSWTNNGGLTNPPTVNIKGPKGDKGDAGEGDGGSGGPTIVEIDAIDYNFVDLTDNTIYLFYGQLLNLEVRLSMPLTKGCLLRFETDTDCTLIIPDCYWANGVIPSIEGNTCYELSLTDNQDGAVLAVLTPFKSV